MNPKNESKMRTIRDLFESVQKAYGIKMAEKIKDAIGQMQPLLITNMSRDNRDANAGKIVQMVAEKYLTIHAIEAGAIAYDPSMEKRISQMVPMSDLEPNCPARISMTQIVNNLLGSEY